MTLASKYSYDYKSQVLAKYKAAPIDQGSIHLWSKDNFYRSSYANHWTKQPKEGNHMAIPNYQGFIPGITSNAEYGKSFSAIARKQLANPKLDHTNKYFSSTGFNFDQKAHIDDSKNAQSHKYGKQQIQEVHPSQKVRFSLLSR